QRRTRQPLTPQSLAPAIPLDPPFLQRIRVHRIPHGYPRRTRPRTHRRGGLMIGWPRRRRRQGPSSGRHQAPADSPTVPLPEEPARDPAPQPWEPIARQFALRVLSLVYEAGSHLGEVERAEQDPDQLQRLYRTDHAITRVRRWAENLQVLAGVRI